MKKVLVAYVSRTGKTQKMAEYIAEGIRFSGNEAELKKINEISNFRLGTCITGRIFDFFTL
jgi:menaquinone-dependent protoporphyrinogen IX oxidase